MRNRFVLSAFLTLAFLTAASSAHAADLTGKWVGTIETPDGQKIEVTFNFQVDGEKLTGTASSSYGEEQITEGTVKGDAVSFVILANGGDIKITYKGKVVGEEVKFTVTLGDMGDRELTIKRAT